MGIATAPALILNAADNGGDKKDSPLPVQITRLRPKPLKNNPRMPARFFIECTYMNNSMYFTLPDHIESAAVSIACGNQPVLNGQISVTSPSIDFVPTYGEYVITAVTDGGTTYEGTITF